MCVSHQVGALQGWGLRMGLFEAVLGQGRVLIVIVTAGFLRRHGPAAVAVVGMASGRVRVLAALVASFCVFWCGCCCSCVFFCAMGCVLVVHHTLLAPAACADGGCLLKVLGLFARPGCIQYCNKQAARNSAVLS